MAKCQIVTIERFIHIRTQAQPKCKQTFYFLTMCIPIFPRIAGTFSDIDGRSRPS
jgi:hypothetical protein